MNGVMVMVCRHSGNNYELILEPLNLEKILEIVGKKSFSEKCEL